MKYIVGAGLILIFGANWVVADELVFAEKDGVVSVEAEHFFKQSSSDIREWKVCSPARLPKISPDADPAHLSGASGNAYLEALPDTRRNHGEKLIHGENFSNQPGKLAILSYRVHIESPGKYYVWVRAYSTGTEDNGIHVGLNGQWPESGQRWQTTQKHRWHWECRQRTEQQHGGVPMQLFLDIPRAGEHEIQFSMREDGFEFDKFVLAKDRLFRPQGTGPETRVKTGKLPPAFPTSEKRLPDGDGSIEISGEKKTWHRITLTMDGPFAKESDTTPNPFTDWSMEVIFRNEEHSFTVPGYFAADGNAGETSADSGTKWRAHFAPNHEGIWQYEIRFQAGKNVAISEGDFAGVQPWHGKKGEFRVEKTDKSGRDFRGLGRLQYVDGERYLRFAETGDYFLKAGPDAPETFLAYQDFDGTRANNPGKGPLKSWRPHLQDWETGDPVWKENKGRGIIGALNYLSDKGLNAFSFLTYNAGGDGDNIWPFIERDKKLHYDCSKLDQWEIVFDHAKKKGLYLHFKLQETEIDDLRGHKPKDIREAPTSLDGGKLGWERKLYLRELVARFGHHLALNWNIGEENTQSYEEVVAMIEYLKRLDPYDHHIVIHTYPTQQDEKYSRLIGEKSALSGASLQNPWHHVHQRTLKWINESEKSGRQWVVANDEQNPADLGVPPDPGYQNFDGIAVPKEGKGKSYDLHDIRRNTLWGNLMAGGAGVEYYFGYRLLQNDLVCEDFRSRDRSWDYCRISLQFFRKNQIPFWKMKNANELVGNPENQNGKPWCLADQSEGIYVVFVPDEQELDLSALGKVHKAINPENGAEVSADYQGERAIWIRQPRSP